MTHHTKITPAALEEQTSTALTRHDGWTRNKQAAFLRELAATHSVSAAARSVRMSRQSAYALRARLKDEPFDRAWTAALICRMDALAEAAMDRALNGVEVPHFYKGELIGTSRKFDERLTVALLAMRSPFQTRAQYTGHPATTFDADEFGRLIERVEQGPQTWSEEMLLEYLELNAEEDEGQEA